MDTLILSCCGPKLEQPAPALELYQNRAWAFAREHLADRFNLMVLSAEYGLRRATDVLEPYERKLDDRRAAWLIERHHNTRPFSMLSAWQDTGSGRFYVYGGACYRELVKFWCSTMPKTGWECIEVIGQNRGIGDHFSALKQLGDES